MKAVRQTAQNAVKILDQFCDAYGMEQIKASYGWQQKPVQRKGRFWAYYDRLIVEGCAEEGTAKEGDVLVGWGGMSFDTRDASDDEAFLSVGVFPEHQRKGYRLAIYDHMIHHARELGADLASIIVLKSNEAQYQRTMREAHTAGSKWIYGGDVWEPAPGYGYFVYHL